MLDQQDGDAPLLDGLDEQHEIRRFLIVHAPGRLVEDEEARFRGQRPRDLQQALVAVGKVPRKVGVLVVQPDEGKLAHGAFHGLPFLAALRGGAEEGGEQPRPHTAVASRQHVLKDAHVLEQPDVLERPGDAQFHDLVGGPAGNVLPIEDDLAGVGAVIAGDDVERRGLPGPVGADQPDDAGFVHAEGDAVHRHQPAESLQEVAQDEQAHNASSLAGSARCTPRGNRPTRNRAL